VSASWTLCGAGGARYQSDRPGTLGGHRRSKLYGRLDCRSARQALTIGGYALHRVFFLDEHTAQAAGYRPCAVCLPEQYAAWKAGRRLPASASTSMFLIEFHGVDDPTPGRVA
jgi:methylphosphotriester-DNA--protein-cysteine methyltransferase